MTACVSFVFYDMEMPEYVSVFTQVYVSKDEIPVLGGECVLCYYCSTLQCIVGISSPFKVSAGLL